MVKNSEPTCLMAPANEQSAIIPIIAENNPSTDNNTEKTFTFILNSIQTFDENTKSYIIYKLIDDLFENRSKSKIIVEILTKLGEEGTTLIRRLYEHLENSDNTTEGEQPENKRNKRKRKQETITDVNMDTNHTHIEPQATQADNEFGFPIENKKRKIPKTNNQNKASPIPSTANKENTEPQKTKQVPPITLPNHQTYQAIKKSSTNRKNQHHLRQGSQQPNKNIPHHT